MPYRIYLKDDIGNEISTIMNVPKIIDVTTLDLSDGLLTKGAYKIPIQHILFIEEI